MENKESAEFGKVSSGKLFVKINGFHKCRRLFEGGSPAMDDRQECLKRRAINEYLYDKVVYDSPLEKENIMNKVEHVIVYGKIPQKSICIPNITNDLYSPDFMYVVQRSNGQKELNIVIETKDVPNDEAKRAIEDAKINNAEKFFQQLKLDGYDVRFCRQLQNKQMANIISELLEE